MCRLTRNQHLLLAGTFVVAPALRCIYLWGQAQNNPVYEMPFMDPGIHHTWAQRIADGQGLGERPFFRAPLYYYLLGLVYKLVGPSVTMGRLLGCALGALSCYLIARVAVELAGFRAGLLAGLLTAVYWPFIYFDNRLLTVALENLLNIAMLLALLVGARRTAPLLFLLGGILWGLSAITRPNVLALAPAIILWLWIAAPAAGRAKHWLRSAALTCAGAALAVVPVTIRNYVVGGEWVLIATNGGVNFYIGNNPQSNGYSAVVPGTRAMVPGGYEDTHRIPEVELGRKLSEQEVSDYWYGKAIEWIRSEPAAFVKQLIYKFRLFWAPFEIPNNQPLLFFARFSSISAFFWIGFPVVASLGVAGMVLMSDWRKWFLPVAFFLIYMVTIVAFFCSGRFRAPTVPILIVTASAGVCALPSLVRSRSFGRLVGAAIACGGCATLLATTPLDRGVVRNAADALGNLAVGIYHANPGPDSKPDFQGAIEHLRRAVELGPELTMPRVELARLLARVGRHAEAKEQFAQAVALGPNDAESHLEYAVFLSSTGENAQALEHYEAAVRLRPSFTVAHQYYGILLANLGRADDAVRQLREALAFDPDADLARAWLGRVLIARGMLDEGLRELAPLLKRRPAQADVSLGLAEALHLAGRHAQAIDILKNGVADGRQPFPHVRLLAWLLATAPEAHLRDGPLAVRLASQASRMAGGPRVDTLDTLAAALAAAGRFEEAVRVAEQAVAVARRSGYQHLAGEISTRLHLYKQGTPFRETRGARPGG